jgi:hypothetical protein
MIRVMQHNYERLGERTIAALVAHIERRVDIFCVPVPPRERGQLGISHSAYEIRTRNMVWTAIRKRSSLVVDERTDLCRWANDDVIATDVRRRGQTITNIVNNYDEKDPGAGERERPARMLNRERDIRQ